MNKAWEGASHEMYAASSGAEAGGPEGGPQEGGTTPGAEAGSEGEYDASDVEYEEVEDDKNSK